MRLHHELDQPPIPPSADTISAAVVQAWSQYGEHIIRPSPESTGALTLYPRSNPRADIRIFPLGTEEALTDGLTQIIHEVHAHGPGHMFEVYRLYRSEGVEGALIERKIGAEGWELADPYHLAVLQHTLFEGSPNKPKTLREKIAGLAGRIAHK